MAYQKLSLHSAFSNKPNKQHITIQVLKKKNFDVWKKKQEESVQTHIEECDFVANAGSLFITRAQSGETQSIVAGASDDVTYEDGAKIFDAIKKQYAEKQLKKISFAFSESGLNEEELNRLHIGCGWASYGFDRYKEKDSKPSPKLILGPKTNKKRVNSFVEAVCLIRDLVNTPANDLGPDELERAVNDFTKHHKIEYKSIKDKELTKQNFPMIFEVGKGSSRRPRLLDFSWGNEKHPKVTLVGKGVCFDTGGLDIKPSQFMLSMKKDMGGAAHVIGLAHMVMSLKLPIRLRVLIPAVENSISGDAYRPSDVLNSRKGKTVEVGNTDAEGRLVLADALTYACEDEPELLIDFATLTGAARIALGFELPALFSNTDKTAQSVQKNSTKTFVNDAVWQLPLWAPYRKHLESPTADISSTGGRAGATTAALFLQEFIDNEIEWIHMDVYSWSETNEPGRPKGGADTGMRAIFAMLQERYGD